MAVDRNSDLEALNAFVDGELSAEQRADLAKRIAAEPALARAHATLAQLRAGLADYADQTKVPEISLTVSPPRHRRWIAAAAAALLAVAFAAPFGLDWRAQQAQVAATDSLVQNVAFGNKPMIPDLSAAGLKLVRVDGSAERPFDRLTAVYTGPRGCRLELHVRAPDVVPAAMPNATGRRSWSDGALVYDLFSFGMPKERFTMVAEAAEGQTRMASAPRHDRLREARRNAPPCLG
jgi:hypothetical protein